MSETNHIASALVEAQGHARALFKEAENAHHRYAYASAEQVIDEARRALGKAGLALIQVSDHLDRESAKGDVIGEARCEYRLVHRSGQEMPLSASMPVIISKGRPDDKAYCAALTTCLAYFLRGLLLIPRDDNAAAIDQRDDRGYDPAEAQRQLADRFAADMANARNLDELEELRADAKRELEGQHLHRVAEAYKARVQEIRGQRQADVEPRGIRAASEADWDTLERKALDAIAKTTNRASLDEAKGVFSSAPGPYRSRVFAAAFKRLFDLIEDPAELGRHATEVRDAGLDTEDLRQVREAYTARREALTRRAA